MIWFHPGGQHDDSRAGDFWFVANQLNEIQPVDAWHLKVGDDQWQRLARLLRFLQFSNRLGRRLDAARLHPPATEHVTKNAPVGVIVVYDQRPRSC